MEEIKFIALPRRRDLESMLRDRGQIGRHDTEPSVLRKYDVACWRIQQAQRKAAVIACEVMRPDDFLRLKQDYDYARQMARQKFEDQAVAVFSEVCTKGL